MEPGRLIIDENGINLPSIEDIYNSLLEEWSSMFPGKETLREDNRLSPQGQLLMSLAKQIDYKNREILFFINQFNTNTATGYFLDLIFNNFGIYRNKETKSYVTCNCVLEPGTTINIGDKIKNTNGDIFISTEEFTAPEPEPKTFDVEFEAENVGAIAVDANTINTMSDILFAPKQQHNEQRAADDCHEDACADLIRIGDPAPEGIGGEEKEGPCQCAVRDQFFMIVPDEQPRDMRHDQSQKADSSHDRRARRRQQHRHRRHRQTRARDVDADIAGEPVGEGEDVAALHAGSGSPGFPHPGPDGPQTP